MMRRSILRKVFQLRDCYLLPSRNSALFINGLKATDTYVYVTPYVDFPQAIKNKNEIVDNLIKRKSSINLEKIENLWLLYEDLKKQKAELEKRKAVIGTELANLLKNNPMHEDIERLKIQSSLLKENIKKLKIPFWSAEEAAIVESLKLPNIVHSQTPSLENQVIYSYKTCPNNDKNHLKIGTCSNLIQFTSKENYYLKDDAALFELGSKFYCSKILKENSYTQFSNPDFVKSLVLEGCGLDHTNPDQTFIIYHNEDLKANVDNRLHLTGGSSLFSFLAYYTKNMLYSKVFPLKYFSIGRQYTPAQSENIGLFNVSQSSTVSTFIATRNTEECDQELENIIELTKTIYSKLGFPFRLSIISADRLQMWESLRVSIEMYSNSMKTYVEIGNISVSGDFISKRLMFTYTKEKQNKYPHLISGTILNAPKFLGCVLEQDCEFFLPPEFKINNWSI